MWSVRCVCVCSLWVCLRRVCVYSMDMSEGCVCVCICERVCVYMCVFMCM